MIPLRNAKRFYNKALKDPAYAADVFGRRLKSCLYYNFCANGKSHHPEAITFFLTHRCNLTCKMCGQWGNEGVSKRKSDDGFQKELAFDEIISVIDDVASFRPNITLFGGEPLLHDACAEIIRYIKRKGMHCLTITNGSLLRDRAKAIVDSALDELNVSLDGNRELHDRIRGAKGLFDNIMAGISEVSRLRSLAGAGKPRINLQCVITKDNYGRLEQLIDVAERAGANSLTFHNLIFLSRGILESQKLYDELLDCSSSDWEGFLFEPGIDIEILYSKISAILSREYSFSVDLYPNFSFNGLKEYYDRTSVPPSEYPARCLSPWMTAYIFPDGRVGPCLNSSYSYGNVRKDKFTELWNNAKARTFRKVLKENRLFPVCGRCTELYRY